MSVEVIWTQILCRRAGAPAKQKILQSSQASVPYHFRRLLTPTPSDDLTMISYLSPLLLLALTGLQTCYSFTAPSIRATPQPSATQTYLFNFGGTSSGSTAKIPSSTNDRDNAAIAAVKAAVQKPRNSACPLVECEFPALQALNKLGDGSLRSSLEAEDANVQFINKLIGGISNPVFGPKVTLVMSSSASNALINKVQKKVKGATLFSLKEGVPDVQGKKDSICVFLTPSSKKDYQIASQLAESGCPTVIVNGSFKVRDVNFLWSMPGQT